MRRRNVKKVIHHDSWVVARGRIQTLIFGSKSTYMTSIFLNQSYGKLASHKPFISKSCCENQILRSRSRNWRIQKQENMCGSLIFWDIFHFLFCIQAGRRLWAGLPCLWEVWNRTSWVLFLSLSPCQRRESEEGEISAGLGRHFRVGGKKMGSHHLEIMGGDEGKMAMRWHRSESKAWCSPKIALPSVWRRQTHQMGPGELE